MINTYDDFESATLVEQYELRCNNVSALKNKMYTKLSLATLTSGPFSSMRKKLSSNNEIVFVNEETNTSPHDIYSL